MPNRVQRRSRYYISHVLPRRNVVGVGLGPKLVGGELTDTLSVHFYVEAKIQDIVIPERFRLPAEIHGVPTDVIEVGRAPSNLGVRIHGAALVRPVRPGLLIGVNESTYSTAGTLGAVVTRDGKKFLLSNNHVLAGNDDRAIGKPVVQPPQTASNIGVVSDFARIIPGQTTDVDVAIAELNVVSSAVFPAPVGPLADAETMQPALLMEVEKIGAETGLQTGVVIGVEAVLDDSDRSIRFVDQIVIRGGSELFAFGGDSGSLVIHSGLKRAVGLLWGARTIGNFGFASQASRALQCLGVRLIP